MADPLTILDNIRKNDPYITTFFIHGSFVTNKTSSRNYKETRVFDDGSFVLSKFELLAINPDIDIVYVSEEPDKSLEIINQQINEFDKYFLTINLMSKETFEADVFSSNPKALKLILIYRELTIIKGKDYIDTVKEKVKEIVRPLDAQLQEEYDFKKDYLRLFAKYNVEKFLIERKQYEELFPTFYKFITGNLKGGFPPNRHKLVYPGPMKLKAEIDIHDCKEKELI